MFSNKESNHEKIVEYIHLSPSTVSWYLKKLEKEQIIKSERKGRKTFYTLLVKKEELGRLLITYRASFLDAVVDRIVEMWDIE